VSDVVARCTALSKTYAASTETVEALHDIDLSVERATVTAVVGPSGSGKTSLLRILAAADRPSSGLAEIADLNVAHASRFQLRRLRRHIGYVFQRPSDNAISYLSVLAHLEAVAKHRGVPPAGLDPVIGLLRLRGRLGHLPHQLSGGELQRLGLAQALVGDPLLIAADEPTAQLDNDSGAEVIQLLRAIADRGTCVIVATHDSGVAAAADRTVALRAGRLESRTGPG